MAGYFTNAITLEQVRAARPEMIYYAVHTCWWTHDPAHLCRAPESGIPVDPWGSPLFQTDDVEGFLAAAEANPSHYGKHGLRAFVAAHHLNCTVGFLDERSTSFRSWDDYNRILDQHDRLVEIDQEMEQVRLKHAKAMLELEEENTGGKKDAS